jgi:hypothetical protein
MDGHEQERIKLFTGGFCRQQCVIIAKNGGE